MAIITGKKVTIQYNGASFDAFLTGEGAKVAESPIEIKSGQQWSFTVSGWCDSKANYIVRRMMRAAYWEAVRQLARWN